MEGSLVWGTAPVGQHVMVISYISNNARIVNHTLETPSEYGAGTYSLNSLKLMSATEAFAKQPKDVKIKACHQEIFLFSLKEETKANCMN